MCLMNHHLEHSRIDSPQHGRQLLPVQIEARHQPTQARIEEDIGRQFVSNIEGEITHKWQVGCLLLQETKAAEVPYQGEVGLAPTIGLRKPSSPGLRMRSVARPIGHAGRAGMGHRVPISARVLELTGHRRRPTPGQDRVEFDPGLRTNTDNAGLAVSELILGMRVGVGGARPAFAGRLCVLVRERRRPRGAGRSTRSGAP